MLRRRGAFTAYCGGPGFGDLGFRTTKGLGFRRLGGLGFSFRIRKGYIGNI